MTPASAAAIERERPSPIALVAAFAAVYIFWGGTFLAIRWVVAELPPLFTIAVRCAGGSLILFAWLAWRGRLERVGGAHWVTAGVAGVFLFLGCHGILAWAEQRVSSAQAALYMTTIPLGLVGITALLDRRRPSAPVLAGLVLGVVGVAVLASGGGEHSGTLLDRLALAASGLFWAGGSLIATRGARPQSAPQATAMQLAAGALVLLVVGAAVGEAPQWDLARLSARGAGAMLFLIVCGTVLGMGAYVWLLRVTSPAAAGSYVFVNPIIALLLAWAVGDDVASVRMLVAAGLVVGAVALTRDRAHDGHAPAAGLGAGPTVPASRAS